MGHPETPVDQTVPARGELAEALRALRTRAGLSYDELAVRTGLSPATLKRAASGRTWLREGLHRKGAAEVSGGVH